MLNFIHFASQALATSACLVLVIVGVLGTRDAVTNHQPLYVDATGYVVVALVFAGAAVGIWLT